MPTPAPAPEIFATHLPLHDGRTTIYVHEGDADAPAYIDVADEATMLEVARAILEADTIGYEVMREVEVPPTAVESLGLSRWWMVPKEN